MNKGLTNSQFYMWRTLFALVHVDNVVTNEEVRFMAEVLEDIPVSGEQRVVLNDDSIHPKNIEEMFAGMTDMNDQAAFFKFARTLVHIDGEYGLEEQEIMLKLKKLHIKMVNVVDLIGNMDMKLEEDERGFSKAGPPPTLKEKLFSFRDLFLKDTFKAD